MLLCQPWGDYFMPLIVYRKRRKQLQKKFYKVMTILTTIGFANLVLLLLMACPLRTLAINIMTCSWLQLFYTAKVCLIQSIGSDVNCARIFFSPPPLSCVSEFFTSVLPVVVVFIVSARMIETFEIYSLYITENSFFIYVRTMQHSS